ncbi:MAG: VWA domain-containing protein [Candidatus Poribacteria bacterium]|nr:VWA domain-containing protein [Candidatus Poribacteria bacterium]
MIEQLTQFHFLRPVWLLLIFAAILFYRLVRRRENVKEQWRGLIASHLLDHLIVSQGEGSRFRPVHLACLVMVIGAVALAGPTWEREIPPFTEDKAPMVIVMDLSRTMDVIDVQPTRLERAKQKIRDLIDQRAGARNALFVYAGSAHMVLPLTEDPSVMDLFLSSLSTTLMPVAGKNAATALKAAQDLLTGEEVPGTILFITDGIKPEHFPAFTNHMNTHQDQIMILGVGTSQGGPVSTGTGRFLTDASGRRVVSKLDVQGLKALRDEAGVLVTTVTLDNADVEWIQRRAQSHLQAVQQEQAETRWRDFGYFLVFPIALLTVFWFRRGWTVRWTAVLFFVLLGTQLTFAQPEVAEGVPESVNVDSAKAEVQSSEAKGSSFWNIFLSLWLTPDQQGRRYFEKGDYAAAAQHFEDTFWKGISFYYDQDYESALNQFALSDSAEAFFYLGNCYARLKKYEEAVESYDQALKKKPDFTQAMSNRDLVAALIEKMKQAEEEAGEPGEPSFDPDEVKFDEKGKKGKKGKIPEFKLKPEDMAEIWMRNIQTTPANFLMWKFQLQAEEQSEGQSK